VSFADRLQPIESVVFALTNHGCVGRSYRREKVTKLVGQKCRRFLWEGKISRSKEVQIESNGTDGIFALSFEVANGGSLAKFLVL